MRAKKGTVSVPAGAREVRAFLEQYREKFRDDLKEVRDLVEDLKRHEPGLRSIYKIYSRGDVQGFDELKTARKVRLKFNEYNERKGSKEASLFEIPDIVGFTIVVPYPSGISAVANVLDRAVDEKRLYAVKLGISDENLGIRTKHGRAIGSNGYYACHYNVRTPGAGPYRPIVEIQIKTLLHDAWGAKTHDLTYKPSGRIGAELTTSFDLLGSNLANLDQQSDALRTSIVRSAEVRERKRRAVQVALLADNAGYTVEQVADDSRKNELRTILNRITEMNEDTSFEVSSKMSRDLLGLFDDGNVEANIGLAASNLLCLLAAIARRPVFFGQVQDIIDIREEQAKDALEKLQIKLNGMLVPFAGGDTAEAIETGEEMVIEFKNISSGLSGSDSQKLDRMRLSVFSNLAYFHADIIGSDEGGKRNSKKCAHHYLNEAKKYYDAVGLPSQGLDASIGEIRNSLVNADGITAEEIFFALDSEAYVRIQCADQEADLKMIRGKLDIVHAHAPSSALALAELAIDYHDYSARTRLAELETKLTN